MYRPGQQVGPFKVIDVKRGFFGIVLICHSPQTNEIVALKTVAPEHTQSSYVVSSFLREAYLWFQFSDVKYFVCPRTFYTIDTLPFLVMEYVQSPEAIGGSTLSDWLSSVRCNLDGGLRLALSFALQVAKGMALADKRISGFVHCDLKPSNILVNEQGVAKISDIGLFRTDDSDLPNARAEGRGLPMSSPIGSFSVHTKGDFAHQIKPANKYQAPEVTTEGRFSQSSDIYAFGQILRDLIECLCGDGSIGRVPLDAVAAHIRLGDTLVGIVRHCTCQDPASRYGAFTDVQKALEEVLSVAYTDMLDWPQFYISYDDFLSTRFPADYDYFQTNLGSLDLLIPDFTPIPAFQEIVKKIRRKDSAIQELAGLFNRFRQIETLRIAQQSAETASALLHLNRPDLAKPYLDKLRECDPGHPGVNVTYGQYYLSQNDYRKASEHYKTEYKLNRNIQALEGMILSLICLGDFDEAHRFLDDERAHLQPERRLGLLGNLYIREERYETALRTYNEASKQFPDYHMLKFGAAVAKAFLAGDTRDSKLLQRAEREFGELQNKAPVGNQQIQQFRQAIDWARAQFA